VSAGQQTTRVDRAWIIGRALFWLAAAFYVVELCRRNITLGDEGYILSQAAAMLDGKVLYRDLDLFVSPGIWYLVAGLFSLAGTEILVTRWAAASCLLATMLVCRRIVAEVGGPRWGDVAPVVIAVFAMWAFPAWSFAFYSPWATLFALIGLACVLSWMRSDRTVWLLACGVACGLSLVFKQNYGAFAAIGCGIAIATDLALRRPGPTSVTTWVIAVLRLGVPVMIGFASLLLPLVALLWYQGALPAAYDSLVLRPFQGFVDSHSIPYLAFGDIGSFQQLRRSFGYIYRAVPMSVTDISSRWPGWALWIVDLLHWGLYWLPPALSLGVLVRTWRCRERASIQDRALLAISAFSLIYFLGVFPRADLNHLINVFQPMLCLATATAAVAFGAGLSAATPLRRAAALTCLLVFAGYSVVAAAWMNDIRKLFAFPVTAPRGGVLVSQIDATLINAEVALIQDLVPAGESTFAIPGLSMIPFLAERPMPTRFYNYYAVHVGFDSGVSAAREIDESDARVILSEYENFFSDPEGMLSYAPALTDYIRREFIPTRSLGDHRHMLLERRKRSRDDIPGISLNFLCRSVQGGPSYTYPQEHLLYSSLHHSFTSMWGNSGMALSVCRTQIPDRGNLHVQLELRQEDSALEGGIARADAWIWPDVGEPTRLFATEWSLATDLPIDSPAPREFDSSLRRWAGETVTLMLRSHVEADIQSQGYDPARLEVIWNDGLLESTDYLLGPKLPSPGEPALAENEAAQ
jgi:hypothetical protein